jgi:hypothetical protein
LIKPLLKQTKDISSPTRESIGTNGGEEVSGTLTVPEVSHECTDGISDYVVSTLSCTRPRTTFPLTFSPVPQSSNGHPPHPPTSAHFSNPHSYPSSSPDSTISQKNSSRQTVPISPTPPPSPLAHQEPLRPSPQSIRLRLLGKFGARRRMRRRRVRAGRRQW